ncbi:MAG: hypothetical protein OK474_02305 [Thaumarchaeota archaeon]|nr:hypothetical protein [Nitrososphaerota archaeon]
MKGDVRRGRTTALFVVVLFAVILVVAYSAYPVGVGGPPASTTAVETVVSPGIACTDPSLSPDVVQVEANPKFLGLSDGLCYSFLGADRSGTGGQSTTTVYTFDYYNGSVVYPCGNLPRELVVSQIRAQVVANGTQPIVQTAQLDNDSSSLNARSDCGGSPLAVSVVEAELVVVTIPAVLEVNLTLDARSAAQPITSLSVVVAFPGADQTIEFDGVTSGTPLLPGRSVSQISIVSGIPTLVEGGVYGMTIEGHFRDGQPFEYAVQIALVNG